MSTGSPQSQEVLTPDVTSVRRDPRRPTSEFEEYRTAVGTVDPSVDGHKVDRLRQRLKTGYLRSE